jgi:hypothetical protein
MIGTGTMHNDFTLAKNIYSINPHEQISNTIQTHNSRIYTWI